MTMELRKNNVIKLRITDKGASSSTKSDCETS